MDGPLRGKVDGLLADASAIQVSSQSNWRERLTINPSRMETELAIKLEHSGIHYLTQVEVPITTVDFYFPTMPRPTLVFVDGLPHLRITQMAKDEEPRTLLRKRGYKVLELIYRSYSDKKRDELYQEIIKELGRE